VARFGIHYPVVLDNGLATWQNFNNHYWPAHYLIDKQGNVVYTHFGEGEYDVTENNIRTLLGLGAGQGEAAQAERPSFSSLQTPETYLGYARAENFSNDEGAVHDKDAEYAFPSTLLLNDWALGGYWHIGREKITAAPAPAQTQPAPHSLRLNFIARKVFLVLGTEDGKPISVTVSLNGKPAGAAAGADVKNGSVTVDSERLYELIDQGSVKNGVLELQTDRPGLQAYAFTFGG
jgi:hypothetical protein